MTHFELVAKCTERYFTWNVPKSDSCLHYLLPEMRDRDITDKLRNAKTFEFLPARTERFRKSFIPHCIVLCVLFFTFSSVFVYVSLWSELNKKINKINK